VASSLRKSILFLVGDEDPRLPNTAFYGYPVFRLGRVQRRGFAPVSELLLLCAGHLRTTLSHVSSVHAVWEMFASIEVALFALFGCLMATYLAGATVAFLGGGLAEVRMFVLEFHVAYPRSTALPGLRWHPDRLNERSERGRYLPSPRVIEEEPGYRRTPVVEHPRKRPGLELRCNLVLEEVGEAHTGQRGVVDVLFFLFV